jgi:predicted Zn-dependent peptidase
MRPFDGTFDTRDLGAGVALHLAPSDKFKTAVLKVFLRSDLDQRRATEIALLPSVLRRGTRSHPTLRELNRALEALYGAQLGGDILKIGEQQVIVLKLELAGERFLPRGTRAFEKAVGLLRDLMLDPPLDARGAFDRAVVEQEKEKQRQFIEGLKNDKAAYAAERCAQEMCKGEPFEVYEYGDVGELASITHESLAQGWRSLLRDAPVDVFVLGAFDPDAATDLVARAFALDRPAPPRLRGTTPNPPGREAQELRERMPVKQGKLCMGLRTSARIEDEGYFGLLFMNGILGAFPHSKLFRNVREKAGLCYYASSSIERSKGLLFIQSGIEAENFEKARDLSLAQLSAIARGEISDEEMTNTALAFHHSYKALLDKPAHLANTYYVLSLGGRTQSLAEIGRRVEATTKAEVIEAAKGVRLDTTYFVEPDGTVADENEAEEQGEEAA